MKDSGIGPIRMLLRTSNVQKAIETVLGGR